MPGTLCVIEPGSRELTATCLIFYPLNALFLYITSSPFMSGI